MVTTIGNLIVESQSPHTHDVSSVRASEPVHDIDVVGCLLQQQPGAMLARGMPILEVEVTSSANEVAAPHRLDLTDPSGTDEVTHRPHDVHVAHVVADVQLRPGPMSCHQHLGCRLQGDRQWFLQVDGDTGLQQGASHLDVGVVRGGDEGDVDPCPDEPRDVAGDDDGVGVLAKTIRHPSAGQVVRLANGHNGTAIALQLGIEGESRTRPYSHHAYSQDLYSSLVSCCRHNAVMTFLDLLENPLNTLQSHRVRSLDTKERRGHMT